MLVVGIKLCFSLTSIFEFSMAGSIASIKVRRLDLLKTLLNFLRFFVKKLFTVFYTVVCIAWEVELVKSGSKLKVVDISKKVVIGSIYSVVIDIMAMLSVRLVFISSLTLCCLVALTPDLNFKPIKVTPNFSGTLSAPLKAVTSSKNAPKFVCICAL